MPILMKFLILENAIYINQCSSLQKRVKRIFVSAEEILLSAEEALRTYVAKNLLEIIKMIDRLL